MIDLPPIRFETTMPQCSEMHDWYCAQTGQRLRFDYEAQRLWHDALVRFSPEELHQVLVEVAAQVKRGGHAGALRLRNFLLLDNIEERLQSMNAARRLGKIRKPPTVQKEIVHDGVRRLIEVPNEAPVQQLAQVMPGALREFADNLAKTKDATCDSATNCRTAPAVREGVDNCSSSTGGSGKMDICCPSGSKTELSH